MVVEGSMCKQPLPPTCPNRRNTKLVSETPFRYQAVLENEWLNFDTEAEKEVKDFLSSDQILCIATLLSNARRQLEMTLVLKEPRPCGTFLVRFCITLGDFNRLAGLDM